MTLVESYSHFSVTSHLRFLPAEINRTLFLLIFLTTSEFYEEGHVSHDTFSDSKNFLIHLLNVFHEALSHVSMHGVLSRENNF